MARSCNVKWTPVKKIQEQKKKNKTGIHQKQCSLFFSYGEISIRFPSKKKKKVPPPQHPCQSVIYHLTITSCLLSSSLWFTGGSSLPAGAVPTDRMQIGREALEQKEKCSLSELGKTVERELRIEMQVAQPSSCRRCAKSIWGEIKVHMSRSHLIQSVKVWRS